MKEYFPQDKLEITQQQKDEFIEAVKRFERFFDTEETAVDVGQSAQFNYGGAEIYISTYFGKDDLEKQDSRVVIVGAAVEDENGGATKLTRTYVVEKDEVSGESEGRYEEELAYKAKGQTHFRHVRSRTDEAFSQELLREYPLANTPDEGADMDYPEELRKQKELEQMTGEYSEMFTLQRFEDVMGILQNIDPERDWVERK